MSNQMSVGTASPAKGSGTAWIWGLIVFAIIATVAYFAQMGAVSPRVANPEVTGVPRPVEFLFGFDHWVTVNQYLTIVIMVVLVALCVTAWRRNPGHPYVLMAIASTGIVWMDPIMNWSPYAVYNPQLWHFPEDWWLVKLSPTVEPFIVIGYALFYFGPFFPASYLLRRMQAGKPRDAFVVRHPLWTMAGLVFVIGFLFDIVLEVSMVRTGLYIYSQAIPFGTLFAGTTFQFPVLWESTFVTFVMIPAAILCYRDDTGRTTAENLARRFNILRSRPVLANFVVMFAILNVAYFMYGASFGVIRASGLATSMACPYPYPEAKVYDPQGYYEREGQPGPYFEGHWATWMTGQPEGRPKVNPLVENPSCLPKDAS